jgi:hypothetical protein
MMTNLSLNLVSALRRDLSSCVLAPLPSDASDVEVRYDPKTCDMFSISNRASSIEPMQYAARDLDETSH